MHNITQQPSVLHCLMRIKIASILHQINFIVPNLKVFLLYIYIIYFIFNLIIIYTSEVTAKKRTSYGKKPDKLRQKSGQVTAKKRTKILKLRQKTGQVTAKNRTSYGKKADKLRQKSGQVTVEDLTLKNFLSIFKISIILEKGGSVNE